METETETTVSTLSRESSSDRQTMKKQWEGNDARNSRRSLDISPTDDEKTVKGRTVSLKEEYTASVWGAEEFLKNA